MTIKIKNAKWINNGKVEVYNADLEHTSFVNKQTGEASLENVNTDGRIVNAGKFNGKNINIFLKRNTRTIEYIGIFLALIGILLTLYFGLNK